MGQNRVYLGLGESSEFNSVDLTVTQKNNNKKKKPGADLEFFRGGGIFKKIDNFD